MPFDLFSFSIDKQVQSLYVAYFGRAADDSGRLHWRNTYEKAVANGASSGNALAEISEAFTRSDEAVAEYPLLAERSATEGEIQTFLTTVYQNLFERAPESQGLEFWTKEIQDRFTQDSDIGDIIVTIANGAANADVATISAKIDAAQGFTDTLADETSDLLAYPGREADGLIDRMDAARSDPTAAGVATARGTFNAEGAPLKVAFSDDSSLDPHEGVIRANLQAAWDRLKAHITGDADAQIDVKVSPVDGPLAQAGPGLNSSSGTTASGTPIIEPPAAVELRGDGDPNGDKADVDMRVDVGALGEDRLELDPNTAPTSNQLAYEDVMLHEMLHGMGMVTFPNAPDLVSSFGAHVDKDAGVFEGEAAVAAYGGAVPINGPEDASHLDPNAFPNSPVTPLLDRGPGQNLLSDVELGILYDIGVPIHDVSMGA